MQINTCDQFPSQLKIPEKVISNENLDEENQIVYNCLISSCDEPKLITSFRYQSIAANVAISVTRTKKIVSNLLNLRLISIEWIDKKDKKKKRRICRINDISHISLN